MTTSLVRTTTTGRSAAYHRQNGAIRLTPRQLRRMQKKYNRTLRAVKVARVGESS